MNRWTLSSLPALAAVLGACASIEPLQTSTEATPIYEASPFYEPPPWNSLEMMWMETEIVRAHPLSLPTG
jgi:hypothetical protein